MAVAQGAVGQGRAARCGAVGRDPIPALLPEPPGAGPRQEPLQLGLWPGDGAAASPAGVAAPSCPVLSLSLSPARPEQCPEPRRVSASVPHSPALLQLFPTDEMPVCSSRFFAFSSFSYSSLLLFCHFGCQKGYFLSVCQHKLLCIILVPC